jgi:hypothetical protein
MLTLFKKPEDWMQYQQLKSLEELSELFEHVTSYNLLQELNFKCKPKSEVRNTISYFCKTSEVFREEIPASCIKS